MRVKAGANNTMKKILLLSKRAFIPLHLWIIGKGECSHPPQQNEQVTST